MCNICLLVKPLTIDHVPPESCLEHLDVQIEPFEQRFRSDAPRLPWSQSGMRFQTLCGQCNARLGDSFDPALAALAREARSWLRSSLHLGDRWTVQCDVPAAVKSLFGHLLAASATDPDTVPDREMREYLLDGAAMAGSCTHVFYWVHDHPPVTVLRAVAMPAVRGSNGRIGTFNILKFPPLGFIVTDLPEYEGLSRLDLPHRFHSGTSEVRLSRAVVRPSDWPERVDPGNFLAVGAPAQDARTAVPRPQLKKKK